MSDSLTAEERETSIWTTDADELVHIWTAQKRYITRMRKNPAFTEVDTGYYGTTEWANFTIPVDRWSPVGVKRQISLSSEQRIRAAERLSEVRP